jgi:hypothetical protein
MLITSTPPRSRASLARLAATSRMFGSMSNVDVLVLQRSRHGKVSFCEDPMEARRTEVQLHWPRRNPQVAGVIFADDGIGDPEAE